MYAWQPDAKYVSRYLSKHGADIKATHFRTNKQGHYGAKERLTITNCGDRNDYSTFHPIISSEDVRSYKDYSKIRRGVLFVIEHRKGIYNDFEENMSKKILCSFVYDLEDMNQEISSQIDRDFEHIKGTILAGKITQAGQIFLHTAPHGAGHGSGTRAFAFTNKFVTKLVSIYTGKPITVKGRSWFIEKWHSISLGTHSAFSLRRLLASTTRSLLTAGMTNRAMTMAVSACPTPRTPATLRSEETDIEDMEPAYAMT